MTTTKIAKPSEVKAVKIGTTVQAKMAEILRLREEARQLFAKADELETELLNRAVIGKAYRLPDGRTAAVSDNFANGKNPNVAWKTAMFRRYEVKTLK